MGFFKKDDHELSWFMRWIEQIKKREREERQRRFVGAIGILMILSLYPYIWGVQLIGYCMHIHQVSVGEVTMLESGWSDALEEYVVRFSVDVEVGRYAATHVQLHTLIYKNDKFIGYLTSDLRGQTLRQGKNSDYYVFEAGSRQTAYFDLKGWRNLETAEALFRELYYGDPEDYTFVTRLMGVAYEDGTDVGHLYLSVLDFGYDENGQLHFSENYLLGNGYYGRYLWEHVLGFH